MGIDATPATPTLAPQILRRARVAPRGWLHRIHDQILQNLTHTTAGRGSSATLADKIALLPGWGMPPVLLAGEEGAR